MSLLCLQIGKRVSDQEMVGDMYCLRWGAHEKNLSKVFRELRRDEHFCDVAIACENLQFQAHKVASQL